jgi:Zn-dependent protease with chaperone function
MTQRKFLALIERLEPYARHQPAAYRTQVALLAVLGYAYVAFIAIGALGVTALLLAKLLALHVQPREAHIACWLIMAPLVAVIARLVVTLFRVEHLATSGYLIQRSFAPELFDMLDEDARALRAPKVDYVLLTGEFNASMFQRPRYGLFGRPINHLEIGLPLMKSLSPDQFRAVLDHELGHLSANHSRFCSWIYCHRQTWSQMHDGLQRSESILALILRPFVSWYSPYFNAYSFVLARSNEYEADRAAAKVAGFRQFAEALVNLRIQTQFLNERFWPTVFRQANKLPSPPLTPFKAMFEALGRGPTPRDAERWFEEALAERTTAEDTHPCLSSRLAALGFAAVSDGPLDSGRLPIDLPPPPKHTAADQYLPRFFDYYVKKMEADWREEVAEAWRKRHSAAKAAARRLEELRGKAMQQGLVEREQWERLALTAEFYGRDATAPLLQEIVRLKPNDSKCLYALGLLLMEHEDAIGMKMVERAMGYDPEIIVSGCQAIYYFLKRNGRGKEAIEYRRRAEYAKDLRQPTPARIAAPRPAAPRVPRTAPASAQALGPEKTVKMEHSSTLTF